MAKQDLFIVVISSIDDDILLTKSKTAVAKHLGLCYNTVHRWSLQAPIHAYLSYKVHFNVIHRKIKR